MPPMCWMFYEVVWQMIKRGIVLLLFLLSFLQAEESHRTIPLNRLFKTNLELNEKTFSVWLAIDPQQKQEGLSFVSKQEFHANDGMLFIYMVDTKLGFWMKNTLIPLDIAYIDADGTIMDIYTMPKMTMQIVTSHTKVKYALELKAGMFKKLHLGVGDKIIFSNQILELSKP